MSSRFTKKSLVSASGLLGKDAVPGLSEVGVQHAHAANEHRHFGRGQGQQLRLVNQQFLGRYGIAGLLVVAEAVRLRLEHGEGDHIGLLLRGVHASRREGDRHLVTGILRSLLDTCTTGQNDQVSQRDLLAAGLRAVERALDALQGLEHLRQPGRLVDFPVLLRRQTNAGTVRTAALVGATEGGRRCPGSRDQLRHRQAGSQDLALEGGDVLCIDQRVIDRGDGVLPDRALLQEPPGRDSVRADPCRGASA